MTIDIVTTTYRSAEKLKKCIESVTEKTKFVDYKFYIWCNDPNDEIKSVIHNAMYIDDILFNDRIVPIFNDTNDGSFSSNNNAAAKEGVGDYILFLNDDTEVVNESWLYSMKQILDTDQKVGAVGALLLYPNNTIQHCGVFFSHKTNNLPFHIHYKQPISAVAEFISVPRYYQAVTAACMLVRRKDFNDIGGFCESYAYGFEDIDACIKIKEQLGKRSVYCPTAQLIHNEGISSISKKDSHPSLQNNIKVFRERCSGKFINDLDFYLRDPKFMIYKYKQQEVSTNDDTEQ